MSFTTRLALLHAESLLRALDRKNLDYAREVVEAEHGPWPGVTEDALQESLELVREALEATR